MSDQSVRAPNSVASAYEDFIGAFRIAAEDRNLSVSLPSRPARSSFLSSGKPEQAVFTSCLYLKGWPARKLPPSKRLDICVKAMETFATPGWTLQKSTVYLNYFLVTSSDAELVQSLHFDFVASGQPDHPLFHVQLSDESIPEKDLREAGFDLAIKAPSRDCWLAARIPTSDMTLASVLYCLVADHLGATAFRQFAEKVAPIQDRLPILGFDSLKGSLKATTLHFKSSHWFAHMNQPK